MSRKKSTATPRPELWAGIECSVNRVGDTYCNQLEKNGHIWRTSDLELFAALGIRTVRYPVLWEQVAPRALDELHWQWSDERLALLRELEVGCIAGLIHHGSGPQYTSLLDPEFPEKLAQFARAVAERYPWLDAYTPINEPLTTARFSGLYGLWYPHRCDDRSFLKCLVHELRGTVLAMKAIREVNPRARFIQTEDLGRTWSTPLLEYQARFDNARRWLSFDLLSGRVTAEHPLWGYLRKSEVSLEELDFFLENPMPPDIIGINHYVTSDRFLDERLHLHPLRTHGGNGRHAYADTEAVRVLPDIPDRFRRVIREAWERYGSALALTEVHLGCTREEQMRWLKEAWDAVLAEHAEGVDVRAMTAWSFLGSFDWNTLLTREQGHYESGVFDVRSSEPRRTALASLLESLARDEPLPHEHLFLEKGWWLRPERLFDHGARPDTPLDIATTYGRSRPLLISGATGTLGRAFARICEIRGLSYRLLSRRECDITSPDSVREVIRELRPWAFLNAAGYVRVDDAESDSERCWRENAFGPSVLARVCLEHAVRLVTFSSDLVFDGKRNIPYVESDGVAPLSVYGRSKADGEAFVQTINPDALVIRTSAFFGPWDSYNFLNTTLEALSRQHGPLTVGAATVSPTYVPDLVNTVLDLLLDGERGLLHLANRGAVSWADFAHMAAEHMGLPACEIRECEAEELGWRAPRPPYSVLGSQSGNLLPDLDDAVARYMADSGIRDLFRRKAL